MALESINPATGEVLERFDEWNIARVDETLDLVDQAFVSWRKSRFDQRRHLLKKAASVLRKNIEDFARTMTLEMGKPIRDARAEVEKCAACCDYYAEHGETFLTPEKVDSDASRSYVRFDPIGTVLAVMPWNFPFWQVFRFAAPALMAGNTAVLKHASNVPRSALKIEGVFREAGFPENIFRTLMIGSGAVGSVIKDDRIKAVTLTGSDIAGRRVAEKAGSRIKKTVLELGGADPFIVLADADLERSCTVASQARNVNSGQSCIAAKRFILEAPIAEAFLARFKERMESFVMGDPLDEKTQIGPQARRDLRDDLHAQVTASIEAGARLITGGTIPEGPGAFYPPTILADVVPCMPAYDEELFGPVASVIVARDAEDAVRIANDTPFGLGASLWTSDVEKAEALAAEIEAGAVFINGIVKSDPRLPFGGIKSSGYGRELSHYGIKEFVNIKTVWIK
ncbi:MAG: NAD-dependent succinate-semialdehyde dehydrogenase [Nitrospirae bacterium]|nr:NAD-dependent succinate-semialdehyde dehydrogenase [Nitrospirota bacterium]